MKLKALQAQPSPENTRAVPGAIFNFLLTGEQTGGEFSLMEINVLQGGEPPAHTHQNESETYYVLDGMVEYEVDGIKFKAGKGDTMFLPLMLRHSFKILSEQAHLLMILSPAGLEKWFWENSQPHQGNRIPPIPFGPPPEEVLTHFVKSLEEYGVNM